MDISASHLGLYFILETPQLWGDGVKITAAPVVTTTNYVDKDGTVDSRYVLKGILDGTTTETTKEVTVWAEQFKKIPLKRPEGGVTLPYDVVCINDFNARNC